MSISFIIAPFTCISIISCLKSFGPVFERDRALLKSIVSRELPKPDCNNMYILDSIIRACVESISRDKNMCVINRQAFFKELSF